MRANDPDRARSREAEEARRLELDRPEDEARELDERAERIAEHGGLGVPDARCYTLARRVMGLPCS